MSAIPTVQAFDKFKHWGNFKEYEFLGIALPSFLKLTNYPKPTIVQEALHTEESEVINVYLTDGIMFTDRSEYLVIYQSNDNKLYARPVADFFAHVDGNIKRFTKI